MVLECLVNWAEWFRGDYKSHLDELKKHGVEFPTVWKHFLDFNFISKIKSANFKFHKHKNKKTIILIRTETVSNHKIF